MSSCIPSSQHWLRFSVKQLIVLLFVASVVLAVLVRPHRQRVTVNAIRRLGGSVTYTFGDDTTTPISDPDPHWLRGIVGEPFLCVDKVNLSRCSVTDSDLEVLYTLKDLRELHLDQTRITDDVLPRLVGLAQLEVLSLRRTRITNKALAVLSDLPSLRNLNLDETRVTSESLCLLLSLPSLERLSVLGLDLSGQDLTDRQSVIRKLQFENRSDTVSDPRVLSTIIQSWDERRNASRSFELRCGGRLTRRGISSPMALQLVVDNKGRVRLTEKGESFRSYADVTRRKKEQITVFDGSVRNSLVLSSPVANGHPYASIRKDSVDWWNYVPTIPIALVYRPLRKVHGGVIAEESLMLTSSIENIDGEDCMVLYHSEGKLWVAPSRNYLPMRFSTIRRGVTRNDIRLKYVNNVETGWVLSSWETSLFDQKGDCTYRHQARVEEHRFRSTVEDATFRIDYPPETLLRDHVHNATYVLQQDGTRVLIRPGKDIGDFRKAYQQAIEGIRHKQPPSRVTSVGLRE